MNVLKSTLDNHFKEAEDLSSRAATFQRKKSTGVTAVAASANTQ